MSKIWMTRAEREEWMRWAPPETQARRRMWFLLWLAFMVFGVAVTLEGWDTARVEHQERVELNIDVSPAFRDEPAEDDPAWDCEIHGNGVC